MPLAAVLKQNTKQRNINSNKKTDPIQNPRQKTDQEREVKFVDHADMYSFRNQAI